MIKDKRLFTFGCSLTFYKWPTWADFVGTQYKYFKNYGRHGSGNFYIASQLYECHEVENLTKDDVVLIMLSSALRFDTITSDSIVQTHGNLLNNDYYDRKFIENFWSEEFGVYSSWFSISSIVSLLKNIGCEYKIMFGFNMSFTETYEKNLRNHNMRINNCLNIINRLYNGVNLMDFMYKKMENKGIKFYEFGLGSKRGKDCHPTITVHHDWVKENMSEYYDDSMENYRQEWEKLIPKDDILNNTFIFESFQSSKERKSFMGQIIKEKKLL